jgi:hypothetical protein
VVLVFTTGKPLAPTKAVDPTFPPCLPIVENATLSIKSIQVMNLPNVEKWGSLNDPYVILKYGEIWTKTTEAKEEKGANAKWVVAGLDAYRFDVTGRDLESVSLHVTVNDQNSNSRDVLIGKAECNLLEALRNSPGAITGDVECKVELKLVGKEVSGKAEGGDALIIFKLEGVTLKKTSIASSLSEEKTTPAAATTTTTDQKGTATAVHGTGVTAPVPVVADDKPISADTPAKADTETNPTQAKTDNEMNSTQAKTAIETNPTQAKTDAEMNPTQAKTAIETNPTQAKADNEMNPTQAKTAIETNPTQAKADNEMNSTQAKTAIETIPTKAKTDNEINPTQAKTAIETIPTKAKTDAEINPIQGKPGTAAAPAVSIPVLGGSTHPSANQPQATPKPEQQGQTATAADSVPLSHVAPTPVDRPTTAPATSLATIAPAAVATPDAIAGNTSTSTPAIGAGVGDGAEEGRGSATSLKGKIPQLLLAQSQLQRKQAAREAEEEAIKQQQVATAVRPQQEKFSEKSSPQQRQSEVERSSRPTSSSSKTTSGSAGAGNRGSGSVSGGSVAGDRDKTAQKKPHASRGRLPPGVGSTTGSVASADDRDMRSEDGGGVSVQSETGSRSNLHRDGKKGKGVSRTEELKALKIASKQRLEAEREFGRDMHGRGFSR